MNKNEKPDKPKSGAKVIQIDKARKGKKICESPDVFGWGPPTLWSERTPIVRFWKERDGWPVGRSVDGVSYVFMAEALREIGEIVFAAEWTGEESNAWPKFQLLPEKLDETAPTIYGFKSWEAAECFAHIILAESGRTAKTHELTEADWRAAYELTHSAWKIGFREPYKRWAHAKRTAHAGLVSGSLVSAVRARAGGVMMPLSCTDWNFDYILAHFDFCQLAFNPNDRTAHFKQIESSGDGFFWIFVTRDSLNNFKREIGNKRAATISTASRYKRWLIDKMQSGINPISKDELAAMYQNEHPGETLTFRMKKDIFQTAVIESGRSEWSKPGPRPRAAAE